MFGRTRYLEQRLDKHEDVCSARYKEIAESIDRIEDKVEKRHRDNMKLLITILLGVAGTFGLKMLDLVHFSVAAAPH